MYHISFHFSDFILWHVDPLLGNGPYTRNRGMRHVRGDVTQQYENRGKRCCHMVRAIAM
jgi:hypothetical protein